MTDTFAVAESLRAHGQEHLLVGIEGLADDVRESYLARLADVDWEELQHPADSVSIDEVGPSRVLDAAERSERAEELAALGTGLRRW